MVKIVIAVIMVSSHLGVMAQNGYLVLKKKRQSLQHYWRGTHFTFQTKEKQWLTGIITKVAADSFYFTQEIIRYHPGKNDTTHFSGFQFSIADVYALPTKKEEIVYEDDRVRVIPGNESFVWVKNGLIFQILGAGYVTLSVVNNVAQGKPALSEESWPGIAVGTAVFLAGTLMHIVYDPYIHLGRKYHLECVTLP